MSKLGVMNDIAKFFSGGKSGAKALLEAYAKFGKEAVNKYFKNRKPSYDVKIDTKKNGGMVKRRAGAAKRGFKNFKGIF